MNRILIYLILFLSFFCATTVFAQKEISSKKSIIYLNDGSIFKGEIIEYTIEEVRLKLRESSLTIEIEREKILDIVHVNNYDDFLTKYDKIHFPYEFKDRGFYQTLSFKFMPETSGRLTNLNLGIGLNYSLGYQLNRGFGLGVGFGFDSYTFSDKLVIFPVFLEARGYLLPSRISPMYKLAFGYGFALKNQELDIVETQQGLLFHPAFGFRFDSSSENNLILDLGVKYQQITYTYYTEWNRIFTDELVQYVRLVLRAELIF